MAEVSNNTNNFQNQLFYHYHSVLPKIYKQSLYESTS